MTLDENSETRAQPALRTRTPRPPGPSLMPRLPSCRQEQTNQDRERAKQCT